MTRKAVTARLKKIFGLQGSIKTLHAAIVRRQAGREDVSDSVSACHLSILEEMLADLQVVERRLASAERAYDADKIGYRGNRRRRADARLKLALKHQKIERFLAACFPSQYRSRKLAMSSSPSSLDLACQVELTIDLLRQIDTLGAPIVDVGLDASKTARMLETGLERLEVAAAGFEAARVDLRASRFRADEAVVEVDRIARYIKSYLEYLRHWVGEL